MQKTSLLFILLTLCTSCTFFKSKETAQQEKQENPVYSLDDSTNIILQLISKNELPKVLQEHTKESLDALIKNFSPAEMAFEAEVLNHQNPVLVAFFKPSKEWEQSFKPTLRKLARAYDNKIKFVDVDSDKLFRIAQTSEVDTFPTFILIHNRKEIGRSEVPSSNKLETIIKELFQKLKPTAQ